MPYTNFNSTTLSGDIATGTTSIGVVDGSIFPTSNFNLLVGNELIFCTSRSTNTLTCVRGVDGSTAAVHASGARIYLLLSGSYTNRNLITRNKLQHTFVSGDSAGGGSTIDSGLVAGLPAAGTAGNLYMPTNGIYQYLDGGSSYSKFGPIYNFTEPVADDFTWFNQGTSTIDSSHGGIYLHGDRTSGDNITGMVKTIPSAPFQVTMAYKPTYLAAFFIGAGMVLRNSSNGKLIIVNLVSGGFLIHQFSSPTSYSGAALSVLGVPLDCSLIWLRYADDGNNRTYSWSNNGFNFNTLLTEATDTFVVPNQIGFQVNTIAQSSAVNTAIHVLHWDEA